MTATTATTEIDALDAFVAEVEASHAASCDTPAARFHAEHLSAEACGKAVRAAMTRAGVDASAVEVEAYTYRGDGYADYDGIRVVCEDEALRDRAVAWLEKSLAPKLARYRALGRGGLQAANYGGENGVILLRRWSLGD